MSALRWEPTPYRRQAEDEIADVPGVGRYRVKPVRNSAGFYAVDVLLNNQRLIGKLSIADAKEYADWHLAHRAALTADSARSQDQGAERAPLDNPEKS
jgi:hypothetical protein